MNFTFILLYLVFVVLFIYMNKNKKHGILFWIGGIVGGAVILLLVYLAVGFLFAYLGISLALLNTPAVLPITAQGNTITINVIIFNNEPNWGTYLPLPQYWSNATIYSSEFTCHYTTGTPCNNVIHYIQGGISAGQKNITSLVIQAPTSSTYFDNNQTFSIQFVSGVDYFGWLKEVFVKTMTIYCKYTPSQSSYNCV